MREKQLEDWVTTAKLRVAMAKRHGINSLLMYRAGSNPAQGSTSRYAQQHELKGTQVIGGASGCMIFKIQYGLKYNARFICCNHLLLLAEPDSILCLGKQGLIVVVRVSGEGVASFLGRGLVGLGLQCRGDAVARSLDVVTELLGGRLLAVGLKKKLG
jgi:hypothetical protein